MNAKPLVWAVICVCVGCKSEAAVPASAPANPPLPPPSEAANPSTGAAPAQPAAEPAKPTTATGESAEARVEPNEKKVDLPDLTHETQCVLMHWTTIDPTWQREPVTWDAATRTLEMSNVTRHLDDAGRVLDLGAGKDHMKYDDAGNITERGGGGDREYRYKNHYDADKRLVSVEISMKPVHEKPAPFSTYRKYAYDAQGRIESMDVQIIPGGELVHVKVDHDAQGRIETLTWTNQGAGPAQQIEHFRYDAQGRLDGYQRDGLVVPTGKPSDGRIDWLQTWKYDAQGHVQRSDVSEGLDPERSPHDITLFSPACGELEKAWPELRDYPYLPLPAAALERL
jgi:hypothetical protein